MTPDARLLRALRQEGSILPSELARLAGLTPEVVAERIDELRAAHYTIEHSPHHGYRLVSTPDRLISDDLAARLSLLGGAGASSPSSRRLGREIVVFEETASTNDVAIRLARSGVEEGVAIFAERQSAGRGRLGRKWESDAHAGLWFSLLLRPQRIGLPQQSWAQLTTWAAVAVAQAVEESLRQIGITHVRPGIKWPNDIYLQGRKAGGILTESGSHAGSGSYAIVGIGINVNQLTFPEALQQKATSIRLAQGIGGIGSIGGERDAPPPPLDRMAVAATLLHHLDSLYSSMAEGFAPILQEAERRSVLIGEWIEVATPAGSLQGMAEGLNADGTLRLRLADGNVETLSGGEVSVSKWK